MFIWQYLTLDRRKSVWHTSRGVKKLTVENGIPHESVGLLESPDSSTVYLVYTDKAIGPSAERPGSQLPKQ